MNHPVREHIIRSIEEKGYDAAINRKSLVCRYSRVDFRQAWLRGIERAKLYRPAGKVAG